MDSATNITINIVEPGSGPIDPVVPNTGLFTSGIGGPEATAIGAVIVLAIATIVVAILYKKHKKQNKTTRLVHLVDSTKAIIKSKKRVTAGLTVLALLASAGTFIALARNAALAADTDEEANDETGLTVDVSSEELTIEVSDEPVFAVMPVEVTVEEATQAGYTLTAYADSTGLVSTTNPDNAIPMIAVEGDELEALTDNTYGLALGNEPTSKDEAVYTTLSIDSEEPTILKSMPDYIPTEAEDTTTIYYGFYITPDIPYGTYTNDSEVYYNATINTTPVTFDGNGLYFNNEEEQQQTTNEIEYIAVPQEEGEGTINQIISGQYQEPSQSLPYNFLGWSTDDQATSPTYTSEQEIAESLPIKPNQPITLYAIWQKVTNIIFNSNDDTGTTNTQSIIAGESTNLNPNTFTREGYNFTGWNTEATPTEQTPGTPYADEAEYTAPLNKSQNITLYAQWKVPTLYDKVQGLVKKSSSGTELTQTAADLKAVITKPTSNDPSTDTSNSGVYKYNASVFGAASDASSNYDIYYYRGILDSNLDGTTSTYGSNGDGAYYPNYVKLGDTCWRIVRTTGSGGVKMIYNGLYSGGTTANSCANAQTNAQVTKKAFNGDSNTNKQAVRVGYTYNSTYATNTAQTASIANVFGSDANPSVNNTDSTIKDYIEDEWFTSAIGSYESKLEPSAGYCNDRTVYNNTSPYTQQTENTSIVTYGTSGLNQLNFGSYVRNMIANGTRTLTLGCARSTVDLYTTSAATNGNKQLSHPVALLTADEAALAGSGGNGGTSPATQSSNYSYSSYMRSGINFWLLSPYGRTPYGFAYEFILFSNGYLSDYADVGSSIGVRPSISLNHETTVKSGTGTATDPWMINE